MELGVYYTPASVVAFLVREALKAYLETELPDEPAEGLARLVEERDPGGVRDRGASLEALRRVRLCDPACGSGAILLGALDELVGLRACLSAAVTGREGACPLPPGCTLPALGGKEQAFALPLWVGADLQPGYRDRLEVVRDNLYGVDLNPAAVETARLRLTLDLPVDRAGPVPPALPDLSARIRVGDSLAGPSLEEALPVGREPAGGFDWAGEFPEVLARGGFDIVVMNPPYFSANRIPGERRESFRQYLGRLGVPRGLGGDLYVRFFHRALQLLRPKGTLSAVTSGSFLTNPTKEPLRRELLRHTLRLIAPLGPDLFPATVYPAITVLQKGGAGREKDDILFVDLHGGCRVDALDGSREVFGGTGGLFPAARVVARGARRQGTSPLPYPTATREDSGLALRVPGEEYERAFGAIFFEPTLENRRLFGAVLSARGVVEVGGRRFVPLELAAPVLDTGIHSGNVRNRLFFQEQPPGRQLPRLLQGIQVVRYGVWWENPKARFRFVDVEYRADSRRLGIGRGGRPSGQGEYWHFCGPIENHHVPERLLMRQTQDEPFVGYIDRGFERVYTDNTLHTLLLTAQGRQLGLTYRFLLAVLNSATVARIYRAIAQEEGRSLAQVKTTIANRLPVLIPSPEETRELELLVAQIQAIHASMGLPLPPAGLERLAALRAEIDRRVAEAYQPILSPGIAGSR